MVSGELTAELLTLDLELGPLRIGRLGSLTRDFATQPFIGKDPPHLVDHGSFDLTGRQRGIRAYIASTFAAAMRSGA